MGLEYKEWRKKIKKETKWQTKSLKAITKKNHIDKHKEKESFLREAGVFCTGQGIF